MGTREEQGMNKTMLQARVKKLLDDFGGREPLRRLFWSELNYERRDDPLSPRGWPVTVTGVLAEEPTILASGCATRSGRCEPRSPPGLIPTAR